MNYIYTHSCALILSIILVMVAGCGGDFGTPSVSDTSITQNQTAIIGPPVLTSTLPVINGSDIPIGTSILLNFNKEINADYVVAELLNIDLDIVVSGDLIVQKQSVQFVPTPKLTYASHYKFILQYQEPGKSSMSFEVSFFTMAKKQSINMILASPVDNQISFAVDSPLTFKFDQNIDNLVDEFQVKLTSAEGKTIAGELTAKGQILTFMPASTLPLASSFALVLNALNSSKIYFQEYRIGFDTQKARTPLPFNSFYPEIKQYGKTIITLYPGDSIVEGEATAISFGIPFPRGFIHDVSHFRLLDEFNNEIPIDANVLLKWQSTLGLGQGIRSALVQANIVFTSNEYESLTPRLITLEWGIDRHTEALSPVPYSDTMVLVDDDEFSASDKILEPKAYAVFEPSWYGDSLVKTRLLPKGSHPELSMFDVAFELFGDTAINYVDPRVTNENLQPFRTSVSSWLFDRAMTLYQLAFRTADIKYIRSAHRASQYYRNYISAQGYLSLKPQNDMKYSYGESLLANYILVGDERNISAIESMVPAWDKFKALYTLDTGFWTERHAAFKLVGYVTAYEATGKQEYKDKATATFTTYYQMQNSPSEGIPKTGALMHTSGAHGEGGNNMIASPWMSALLVDAVERYYLHTSDNRVPNFVSQLADYFIQDDISLYVWKGWGGKEHFVVPHYLAGKGLTSREHGGGGNVDLEHTPDVTKIFSLAYFFSCQQGNCNRAYLDAISDLNKSASYIFPYWIRTAAAAAGRASYRLSPPRKFNWWFKNIANNDFLIGTNTVIERDIKGKPNVIISQSFNQDKGFKPKDDITLTVEIANSSLEAIKNIVVAVPIIKYSAESLISVLDISDGGKKRDNTIVWKIGELASQKKISLTFNFTINDFPAAPTVTRPIDKIISFATVSFCGENDRDDTCRLWESSWDLGIQTYSTMSPWLMVRPAEPDSPPLVKFVTPLDSDIIKGNADIVVIAEDVDGLAKVELRLDGQLLTIFDEPPYIYNFAFDTLPDKPHSLSVNAWDIFGSRARRVVSIVPGNPDTIAPLVSILSPKNSQNVCRIDLQYIVNDTSNYQCTVTIGSTIINRPSCQNLLISKAIPLYSAKAYLSFDRLSETIVGGFNDNLIFTSSNVQMATGKYDGAYYFNGVDAETLFSETKLDIHDDVSVSFWLKPSSDEGVIISQDWEYIGVEQGWAISLGANNDKNNNPLSITWSSGDNVHNANNSNVVQTDGYTVKLNQWQHVIVRKKGSLVDIFIDGVKAKSKEVRFSPINWSHTSKRQLAIAKAMKHPNMYQKSYHGSIDDLAIFNRSLTDIEVSQLSHTLSSALKSYTIEVSATDFAGNRGSDFVSVSEGDCTN